MFAMHLLAPITLTLNALQVRAQYVTFRLQEKNNKISVLVHKPNSKKVLRVVFRASEIIDQKYVQKELYKAALFYHNGSIPTRQTPWQRMWQDVVGCWTATPRLMRVGLTLFVIAVIAKLAGLYK